MNRYTYQKSRKESEQGDSRVVLANAVAQLCYDVAKGDLSVAVQLYAPLHMNLENTVRNWYEINCEEGTPMIDLLEAVTEEVKENYEENGEDYEEILKRIMQGCHKFFGKINTV
jgi:hypothetical protein